MLHRSSILRCCRIVFTFCFAPTRRTQGSPWPSSHRRGSSDSASSCTLDNHSWIGSSQSFQKETRRTYHDPIPDSSSRVAHDPTLASTHHFSNRTTEATSSQGSQSHQPHHRPEFKPRPLSLGMHSTLSGAFLVLLRWMERHGCGHASHLWELP